MSAEPMWMSGGSNSWARSARSQSLSASVEPRLFADARRGAADVEGTHRELSAGFADGLRRDDAGGFTEFDQTARSEVTPVARDADAALGFAGQHGADLNPLDAG